MIAVACALLGIGYLLTYVAGSNLAHGPGKGVGFLEALGFDSATPASPPAAPAAGPTSPQTKPGHQGGGSP